MRVWGGRGKRRAGNIRKNRHPRWRLCKGPVSAPHLRLAQAALLQLVDKVYFLRGTPMLW